MTDASSRWERSQQSAVGSTECLNNSLMETQGLATVPKHTLLDGSNVRLNWNIESDMNVNWIKFKNYLSLY